MYLTLLEKRSEKQNPQEKILIIKMKNCFKFLSMEE